MFENDYIMRMIHEMVRAMIRLLLGVDTDASEALILPETVENDDFQSLLSLVEQGQINEAENRLSDLLLADPGRYFKVALLFYDYLNEMDDDALAAAGYSREEIADGLKSVMAQCGHGEIADTFLL